MTLAGLLLAAGGATRFGSPKVLAPYRGEPLVRRAVHLLVPRCPAGVHVVVGAAAAGVRSALAGEAVMLVDNPDWPRGLSTSLVCGVAALPPAADAVLILLCDQPAITAADLDALIAAWQVEPELIAAAGFSDRLGPPVIIPRDLLAPAGRAAWRPGRAEPARVARRAHDRGHAPRGPRRGHAGGSGAARSGSGTMRHGPARY